MESLTVFGIKIELCSTNPMPGLYRNGCCETGPNDYGTHTVCAKMDEDFLEYIKNKPGIIIYRNKI